MRRGLACRAFLCSIVYIIHNRHVGLDDQDSILQSTKHLPGNSLSSHKIQQSVRLDNFRDLAGHALSLVNARDTEVAASRSIPFSCVLQCNNSRHLVACYWHIAHVLLIYQRVVLALKLSGQGVRLCTTLVPTLGS